MQSYMLHAATPFQRPAHVWLQLADRTCQLCCLTPQLPRASHRTLTTAPGLPRGRTLICLVIAATGSSLSVPVSASALPALRVFASDVHNSGIDACRVLVWQRRGYWRQREVLYAIWYRRVAHGQVCLGIPPRRHDRLSTWLPCLMVALPPLHCFAAS